MTLLGSIVTDQNEIAVVGASVYVYGASGDLADLTDSLGQAITQPITTDDTGYWQAYTTETTYRIDYYWGGRLRLRDVTTAGPPGPADGGVYYTFDQFYLAADGANWRPAIQRAITAAAAAGVPCVLRGSAPRAMEVWEPAVDDPNGSGLPWFYRNRTIQIPACNAIDLDFQGATITLKGPAGGARFPGQTATAVGGAAYDGKWNGGFITCTGNIGNLRIANVDVEGGFTGDTVNQNNFNLYDKGFLAQDLTIGRIEMHNAVLHGFGGEIMYDNSSAMHVSRDCHFYNSGHSCWNPSGVGRLVAYNLQAGISRQPAEVVGGVGHTYIGGRFYKAGGAGSTFIGGPDPGFDGIAYNNPVRRTDAPPPYVTFHGTRFEDYATGYLYLGSYMRGSIICTDVPIFLSAGFASAAELKDIDLDIISWADRLSAYNAVTMAGQPANGADIPKNINLRVHCGKTELAQDNARYLNCGVAASGWVGPNCSFEVSGHALQGFAITSAVGSTVPRLAVSPGFVADSLPSQYIAADTTVTIASEELLLYDDTAADGTYAITIDATRTYTHGQEVTIIKGSSHVARIFTFAMSGAGMTLAKPRALRRGGDRIKLRYSAFGASWYEVGFVGDEAPYALTDAATVTPNFAANSDFEWTIGGNRTLANPTNAVAGQKGKIKIVQDGTGTRVVTYGANWRFPGGSAAGGVLSVAANAVDVIDYEVGSDGKVYGVLGKAFAA